MYISRRFILSVSQLSKNFVNSQKSLSYPVLQNLSERCECRKKFQSSAWRLKNEIPSSVSLKNETFSEESPVILDIEKERENITEEVTTDPFEGLNLKRGTTGVFDIEEIVELLRKEKAQDIFVVKIPPEYNYVDYMVVVTGRSKRHMLAVFEFIRKVYKRKMSPNDTVPNTEGLTSKEWMAIDLGNIAVHMFTKKARNIYDLESLWSLGREYDSFSQEKVHSESYDLSNYENILAKLIPNNDK